MVINHNMSAIYSARQEGIVETDLQKSMEKLSSGERINRAGDDSADLGAYQNRFEMAQKGIDVAAENLTVAESWVRNTERDEEMANYAKKLRRW